MRRWLVCMVLVMGLAGMMQAQTIKEGTRWWNGETLYTAHVDEAGNVTMEGESEDRGGDTFVLKKTGDSRYTLASGNSQGWLFVRGQIGWQVDDVVQDKLHFLAVRNPRGEAISIYVLTPDDLKGCLARQKTLEKRDVSWLLQNYLLDAHYLGHFSKPQLRLMRNEILARHGWNFQSKDLQEHFSKMSWYKPVADNNSVTLGMIETTNLQLLKYEESLGDHDRVRYERTEENPKMTENVKGVITVNDEEQFLNALGNYRTVQIGANVHLNLSRVLEQENLFAGVPGRSWVTVVKKDRNSDPVIISEFCNDGQQLTLKHFNGLTIRGTYNSSIEVDPRYAYCLNLIDCWECKVENLTIGHTEYGYCDGGVIGVWGGGLNSISDCDLYGCGTYGIVGRETATLKVARTNIHHCSYGIMELWDAHGVEFEDCDFFDNKEFTLIGIGSSEETVFRGCRFYNNWAQAELFSSGEPFHLYDCEIHHPTIGGDGMLIADNCIFGNEPVFSPKPRQKPIGPDAPKP